MKYISRNSVTREDTVTVPTLPSRFSLPSLLTCLPVETTDSKGGDSSGLGTTVFLSAQPPTGVWGIGRKHK